MLLKWKNALWDLDTNMNTNKKGLVITTFNREDHFKTLYDSIPFHKVDIVVVVNGGEIYTGKYPNVQWIQHEKVKFPSVARNDGIKYLIDHGCDYIFVSEDDMIIKSENIFDEYINASKLTGIEYFCFASYAWDAGPVGSRTPRIKVQYSPDVMISFYKNTTNEFTFRTKRVIEDIGYYNEQFKNIFDIEWIYRISKSNYTAGFWYFPDIANSDDLIMNNPDAESCIDPKGNRWATLQPTYDKFKSIHGLHIHEIPLPSQSEIIEKLKLMKPC